VKYGANSFIWTDSFGTKDFGVLPAIKEAGLDGIEIGLLDPGNFDAAAFRKASESLGLGCTSCGVLPQDSSLISQDKAQRTKAREYIELWLHKTVEAGGGVACGPLYAPVGNFTGVRRTSDEWKRGVEGWQEIAPLADKLTIDVAIEPLNRFEAYFLNTVEDSARFCDEIGSERVGILADTFHANIEEKSIGKALISAGKHLKHLHSCENDRGIPGSGNVNWAEFFQTVKAIGYDRWMVIESFGFSLGGLSAAASIWRDLAAAPERIPFDGVKFLRQNL
jgi:D-psicose/D-tagatose/L-ribulose 3-epimerase